MARRNLVNIKEKILLETIKIGANEGIDNIPAKKIADGCDITDATVFVNYETKENLLVQAYLYVLHKVENFIGTYDIAMLSNAQIYEMWDKIFTFLVDNQEMTKYFVSFRSSKHYVSDLVSQHKDYYIASCKVILARCGLDNIFSDNQLYELWDNFVRATAMYAIKVADNKFDDSAPSKKIFYALIFGGIK